MNKQISCICLAMVVLVFLAQASVRGDDSTVDNPLYTAWSKTTVGSIAEYAGDLNGKGGKKVHFTGTLTLKDMGTDAAKIEQVTTVTGTVLPAESLAIPAKGKAGDVVKKESDTVHAMDKDFKCDVYDINFALAGAPDTDKPGARTTATIYVCSDIPGGVVKMIVHPPAQVAVQKEFEVVLQSFKTNEAGKTKAAATRPAAK